MVNTVSSIRSQSPVSGVRASDGAVHLNANGTLSTGRTLKGVLVTLAESLGLFKEYTAAYRADQALSNRNAYQAAWQQVRDAYGFGVMQRTKEAMAADGYQEAFPWLSRLKGRDPAKPERTVTGEEVRKILDTAAGIYQSDGGREDDFILADMETRPWQIEPGPIPSHQSPDPLSPRADPLTASASLGASASLSASQAAAAAATTSAVLEQVPKELARATLASNQADALALVRSEQQLAALANKLGHSSEAVLRRRAYVESEVSQQLAKLPEAAQAKLTKAQLEEIVGAVIVSAVRRSVARAQIAGAMGSVKQKLKGVWGSEVPAGKVDVLSLSRQKVRAACNLEHLKQLAAQLPESPVGRVKPSRLNYISRTALAQAESLVLSKQSQLSNEEVDQVLKEALVKSLSRGELANRFKGVMKRVTTSSENQMLVRDVATVRQELASEEAMAKAEAGQAEPPPASQGQTPQPARAPSPQRQASQAQAAASLVMPDPIASNPPLPKPAPYKGVDFFDYADPRVGGLAPAIKNHQRAKQVVADDRFLAHALEGRIGMAQLTPVHRDYIKTTLLRRVDDHQRMHPGELLTPQKLGQMLGAVASRAVEVGAERRLRTKLVGKKIVRQLGRSPFERELADLKRSARRDAAFRFGKPEFRSFMHEAARKHGLPLDVPTNEMPRLKPHFKKAAESFVSVHRTKPDESDWQAIAAQALRQRFHVRSAEATDEQAP